MCSNIAYASEGDCNVNKSYYLDLSSSCALYFIIIYVGAL